MHTYHIMVGTRKLICILAVAFLVACGQGIKVNQLSSEFEDKSGGIEDPLDAGGIEDPLDAGGESTGTSALTLNCQPADGETNVPRNTTIVCDTDQLSETLLAVEVEETSEVAAISTRRGGPFRIWYGRMTPLPEENRYHFRPNSDFPAWSQVCYSCNDPSACEEGDGGCFTTAGDTDEEGIQFEEAWFDISDEEGIEVLKVSFNKKLAILGNVVLKGRGNEEIPTEVTTDKDKKILQLFRSGGEDFDEGVTYKVFFDGSTEMLTGQTVKGSLALRKEGVRAVKERNTIEKNAPKFSGLSRCSAVSSSHIDCFWADATDDSTPPEDMIYQICVSEKAGQCIASFSETYSSEAGKTSYSVRGLKECKEYFFVGRAVDDAGNRDSNREEISSETLDETAPTFSGLAKIVSKGPKAVQLSWDAASDSCDTSITYKIYRSLVSGGQDLTSPVATAKGTSMTDSGLSPVATYYYLVRACDSSGNCDGNKNEMFLTTEKDTTPPTFAGLKNLSADQTKCQLDLSWSEATDDVSSSTNIVYKAYCATKLGGQNFKKVTDSSSAGATSITVSNVQTKTTYFCVVRAIDEASNEDQNTTELSATTPAKCAAPGGPVIQIQMLGPGGGGGKS